MNNFLKYHLYHHQPKGLGETPATCSACQAELEKFKQEAKGPSFLERVALGVATGLVSAIIIRKVLSNHDLRSL